MTSIEATGAPQVIANRYEVIGLLGVGGMGAVYKVRDRELDEVVALKMLKRDIADSPGIVERFRREVKLARRVTHSNVARTFDLGEHEGERFLTMELIEGESLQALLMKRQRHLSLPLVVEVLSSVCAGLEAAHAAGVVHRDLKPDNVMITGGGRVVITDFGIARAQGSGAALRTQVPIGTPAYMSPEQVEARADVDARADIYALGAMAFELLTGRLPFEADSVFVVASMRLTEPPPDPRTHRPELPAQVAQIVMKCMARRPEDRFGSAHEIAIQLGAITLPRTEMVAKSGTSAPPRDGIAKTVAVLPFHNATGVVDDDYLVDGLTDDLIDSLSMAPGLRVRPRGLVMQHKASTMDPRDLGRRLEVQAVVEGSVRAAQDTLRVSARVLSVEDGFQIWARRFDGSRADLLKIGDELAHAVAEALVVRKPERPAVATDPVAVELYLKGRHEYVKFWRAANDRAIELLAQAHERAPQDPLIMSGYAAALARFIRTNAAGVAEVRAELAAQIAAKAVELAPQLPDAHVALALVRLHALDPAGAAAGAMHALALSPLCVDAHELRARLLGEVGELREAIEAAEQAMRLDPRIVHLEYAVVSRAHLLLGDWEEAGRILETPPEDADHLSLYWVSRLRAASWRRDVDAVREVAAQATTRTPFSGLPVLRRLTEWMLAPGTDSSARAFVPVPTQRESAFFLQLRAEVEAFRGEDDAAMESIARAAERGLFDVRWLERCPLLENVRGRPRFEEIRAAVSSLARRVLVELRGNEATVAS